MALNPSFSASPSIDPSAIVLADTSTGSDPAIVSRQILIYTTGNTPLVPAIAWPLATNPFTINPLQQDQAVQITINWLASDGITVLYTSSQIFAFVGYGNLFIYQLTQNQSSTPNIVNDTLYYSSKLKLIVEIQSALNAISTGNDIYGSQSCINRYTYLMQNNFSYF